MSALLLQFDTTEQRWVRLGAARSASVHRTPGRKTGAGYRTVTVELIEVDPPVAF